jgi:hypothetical protein
MNTNQLAKHYDKLTAMERFQLIKGAIARQDEEELERLKRSAPFIEFRAHHHHAIARHFWHMETFHLLKLVDIAAAYFEALAKLRNPQPQEGATPGDDWGEALSLGYVFKMHWAGWRQFCAELNLDPEDDWVGVPGYYLVKRAEKAVEANPEVGVPGGAFSEEQVMRYMARYQGPDPASQLDNEALQDYWPETADVAVKLRDAWEEILLKDWETRELGMALKRSRLATSAQSSKSASPSSSDAMEKANHESDPVSEAR